MSKCPDCGIENVPYPEGTETHCGRRITWAEMANESTKDWRSRMSRNEVCKDVARRREMKKNETWTDDDTMPNPK